MGSKPLKERFETEIAQKPLFCGRCFWIPEISQKISSPFAVNTALKCFISWMISVLITAFIIDRRSVLIAPCTCTYIKILSFLHHRGCWTIVDSSSIYRHLKPIPREVHSKLFLSFASPQIWAVLRLENSKSSCEGQRKVTEKETILNSFSQ